jgi:hypothetical protein
MVNGVSGCNFSLADIFYLIHLLPARNGSGSAAEHPPRDSAATQNIKKLSLLTAFLIRSDPNMF